MVIFFSFLFQLHKQLIIYKIAAFVIQYEPGTPNDIYAALMNPDCIPRQRQMRLTHLTFAWTRYFNKGYWRVHNTTPLSCIPFVKASGLIPRAKSHMEVMFRSPPGLDPSGVAEFESRGTIGDAVLGPKQKYTHGAQKSLSNLCDTNCGAFKRVVLFTPFEQHEKSYLFFKLESASTTSSNAEFWGHAGSKCI